MMDGIPPIDAGAAGIGKELITNKKEINRKGKCLNSEIVDKQEHQSAWWLAKHDETVFPKR